MFNYDLKTKIISGFILALLIAGASWLVSYNRSRSQDLLTVIQAKNLAIALEKYYDQRQNYPIASSMPVDDIMQISEQGINQEGNKVYWQTTGVWPRSATYVGQSDNYAIYFTLENAWTIWGLKSLKGGVCGFTKNVVWQCQAQ
ncbi:MAG: hypothetical protein WC465_02890 [Patescibacteria group bacterium]